MRCTTDWAACMPASALLSSCKVTLPAWMRRSSARVTAPGTRLMAADDEEAKDVEVVISLILYIQVSIDEKMKFEKGVKPDGVLVGRFNPLPGSHPPENGCPVDSATPDAGNAPP